MFSGIAMIEQWPVEHLLRIRQDDVQDREVSAIMGARRRITHVDEDMAWPCQNGPDRLRDGWEREASNAQSMKTHTTRKQYHAMDLAIRYTALHQQPHLSIVSTQSRRNTKTKKQYDVMLIEATKHPLIGRQPEQSEPGDPSLLGPSTSNPASASRLLRGAFASGIRPNAVWHLQATPGTASPIADDRN